MQPQGCMLGGDPLKWIDHNSELLQRRSDHECSRITEPWSSPTSISMQPKCLGPKTSLTGLRNDRHPAQLLYYLFEASVLSVATGVEHIPMSAAAWVPSTETHCEEVPACKNLILGELAGASPMMESRSGRSKVHTVVLSQSRVSQQCSL